MNIKVHKASKITVSSSQCKKTFRIKLSKIKEYKRILKAARGVQKRDSDQQSNFH